MPNRQTISQNLRWLAAGNLAVKPLWFLFLLMSTRYLGPEEFGRFMFALSFISVLAYILEGGLDAFVMREIARNHDAYQRLFAASATLKVLSGAAVACIGVLSAVAMGLGAGYTALIAIAGLHPVTNGLMTHIRFAFRGLEVMQYEARSIMMEKATILLFCGVALLVTHRAEGFMLGFVASYLVACLFTLYVLRRQVGMPDLTIRWRMLWPGILRPALPFALMGMFMVVYYRAGTLMLQWLTGSETQVGYYSAGYRLVEGFALLPGIVVMPLYATFARSAEDKSEVQQLLPRAARGLLVLSCLVSVPMLVYATDFTLMLYGERFLPAASAIGLTVLTMIPVGMTWLFVNLAGAVGRQRVLNRWIVGVTVLNLVLNFVLISAYGVNGAAWAALLTESAMALSASWVVRDYILGGTFLRIGGGIIVPIGVLVLVSQSGVSMGTFPLQLVLALGILIGGFLLFRVVRVSELRELIAGARA